MGKVCGSGSKGIRKDSKWERRMEKRRREVMGWMVARREVGTRGNFEGLLVEGRGVGWYVVERP